MTSQRRARLMVVGLGNTLAGDDGVGVRVAEALARRYEGIGDPRVLTLGGDLFEVAELIPDADHFLFLDAIAGSTPGEIRNLTAAPRALAASMHQSDIGSVMATLAELGISDPFPTWEVWGIVIAPPDELREGLSPVVAAAAARLESRVAARVERLLSPP